MKRRWLNYFTTIPTNETYEYVYINLDSYKVKAIMDALPCKSDSPNIDFVDAVEYTGTNDSDYQQFRFAYHGDGILIETNTEDVDEGELILKIRLFVKEVSDNINQDLENELKSCYASLYMEDLDTFYISLNGLSTVKKNLISENKETKPVVRKKYSQIKLNGC